MTKLERWKTDESLEVRDKEGARGEEEGVYYKGNNDRDPCGGGNVLYLNCGGGYTNIHMG